MHDPSSADQELIAENAALKQRILNLERADGERKRVEAALQESEERLADAQAVTKVGSWETDLSDLSTLNVAWSKELFRVFDVAPDRFRASHAAFLAFVHPEDRANVDAAFAASFDKPSVNAIEHRIVTPSGLVKVVEERWRIVHDDLGQPVRAVGTCQDITERKRAEEALKQSELKYRSLIESSSEAIFAVDDHGRYQFANAVYASTVGHSPEYFVGKTFWDVYSKEQADYRFATIARVFQTGQSESLEIEVPQRAGVFFLVAFNPIRDDTGKIALVLSHGSDITERKQIEAALQASEKRSRQLFASLPQLVWTCTLDGLCDYLSPQWVEYTGIPERTQLGFGWLNQLHADDREPTVAAWNEAFASGSNFTVKFRIRRHDGVYRWFYTSAALIHGPAGSPLLWFGSNTDINDLVQAEAALVESEARLRLSVRWASLGLWDWDRAAGTVYFSPEWKDQIGYQDDELPNLFDEWQCRLHPDDLAPTLQTLQAYLAHPEGRYVGEFRLRHKDGSYRWINSHADIVQRDAGGQPVRMVGAHLDVTDYRQAEEALRESEYRWKFAVEGSGDGLWDWNVPAGTVFFTPRWKAMLGFAEDEVGNSLVEWSTRVHPDDLAPVMADVQAHLAGTTTYYVNEHRVLCKDGTWKWILDRGVVVSRDAAGTPLRMIGSHSDITERKQAEEEKAALRTRLQQSQKLESIGRLAGGVAHEFNNMLGVILGYTEMALDQVDPDQPLHADLEEISKAATRSAYVTRQLLAFARKQIIVPRALDLNETVAGTLTMLGRLIGENIQVTWRPAAGLWPIKADPTQIGQILTNLCLNARDAISGVGHLTIDTGTVVVDEAYCAGHPNAVPGQYVFFTVSDDGRGMDQETLAKVFEPFFTTKDVGKGTGLGLSSVQGIVLQHGGFVSVSSTLGVGTTFRIHFPGHAEKTVETLSPAAVDIPNTRGETILVVEDEPALLEMTARLLEGEGYTVLAAPSTGEALRLAREHAGEIHLLLTDVLMPEMNGDDLARQVVALRPQVRSLFMSGYPADIIAEQGVLVAAGSFIQKPFTKHALVTNVRQVLDRDA